MGFGDHMAGDGDAPRLGQGSNLHPRGDSAYSGQVDDSYIHRPGVEGLLEWVQTEKVLARCDSHVQHVRKVSQSRQILVGHRVFEPDYPSLL